MSGASATPPESSVSNVASPRPGFVEWVGLALVAPRARIERVLQGDRGIDDVAWLLGLKILVGETPRIARALLSVGKLGLGAALSMLLSAAGTVLPDLLAILVGGVLLALLGGGRAARGRETDLAAGAWIPYFAVRLAATLLFTVLQRMETPVEDHLIDALGASASAWVFALALARMRRVTDGDSRGDGPARAGAAS